MIESEEGLDPGAMSETGKEPEAGEKFRVYDSQGQFCAVYVYDRRHKIFKNEKMFV